METSRQAILSGTSERTAISFLSDGEPCYTLLPLIDMDYSLPPGAWGIKTKIGNWLFLQPVTTAVCSSRELRKP
jgi:hypothetical protein